MYSAKIEALDADGKETVVSDVILFSPQISGDTSDPVVDIPEVLRVPVYVSKTFDLSEYISEMNSYDILFDQDVRIDENGNGILDDDYTKTASQISLVGNSLIVARHTTLDTHEMLVKVTDEQGNLTVKPLTIEIYAPVPQIDAMTGT